MFHERLGRTPLCLTLPGLDGSGPEHWQSIWERERAGVERVDLGNWNNPSRNLWGARLDRAVAAADAPVVLVAHSLSCHLVAWWAAMAGAAAARSVVGALLVAPPDLDRMFVDNRLAAFAPSSRRIIPFTSIVIASRNDPWCDFGRAREMAGNWLATFCDAGNLGHINSDANIGRWADGERVLDRLLDHAARPARRGLEGREGPIATEMAPSLA